MMTKKVAIGAMKGRRSLYGLNRRIVAVGSLVVMLTAVFFAGYVWAAISATSHNLSAGGSGSIKAVSETEICVFCHTPHGASSERPLWNHQLSSAVYTLPSGGFLLTTIQQPDMGSRLCLSCHDGTVALGALVNAPGPGNPGTVTMTGVDALGRMPGPPGAAYGWVGTDISGTHPVSIAVNDQLIADKNSCSASGSFMLQYPPAGDPVKLRPTGNKYPNAAGTPGKAITTSTGFVYNAGVQCTSCHDPHDDTNGDFLVKGSPGNWTALCDTCHYSLCP